MNRNKYNNTQLRSDIGVFTGTRKEGSTDQRAIIGDIYIMLSQYCIEMMSNDCIKLSNYDTTN